ncbi:hypothetical protein PR048_005308 [Dryococelus australis]|uniref:HAT C-terminal dimerisation domain-containing protein n=1 Tax=Dryococelus australis TaxID=614101 RepID=A0ABQ9I7T6_9NEOP|nr:hypothetical protein PR048_005308 [Dryococelus australis]
MLCPSYNISEITSLLRHNLKNRISFWTHFTIGKKMENPFRSLEGIRFASNFETYCCCFRQCPDRNNWKQIMLHSKCMRMKLQNSRNVTLKHGLFPVIVNYLARSDPFQIYVFTDEVLSNISVLQWWRSQEKLLGKQQQRKISIFVQLFKATASSAGVERVFSTFCEVQSKL